MSQCFKLVNGGFVDKVIVFDALPERLLKGVRTRACDGFPRAWARWLAEIGSTQTVFQTETTVDMARNWKYTKIPIGKEPCFYVLEYTDLNSDKEAWRNISEFIRTTVGPQVRLREKIEDMAMALAPNSTASLSIEPEDVPTIPIPEEVSIAPSHKDLVKPGETIIVDPKRRGRPKKLAVEA